MSSNARRKRVLEEKPMDFEKITLEFNLIYNKMLAYARDGHAIKTGEHYEKLHNLYFKIKNEELTKEQHGIIEKRMEDAFSLAPSTRPFFNLKNKKI